MGETDRNALLETASISTTMMARVMAGTTGRQTAGSVLVLINFDRMRALPYVVVLTSPATGGAGVEKTSKRYTSNTSNTWVVQYLYACRGRLCILLIIVRLQYNTCGFFIVHSRCYAYGCLRCVIVVLVFRSLPRYSSYVATADPRMHVVAGR